MDKDVIITQHAIDEYLNDHPTSDTPDIDLRMIFRRLYKAGIKKKLDWWNFNNEKKLMSKGNDTIVYKETDESYLIITYYKPFHEDLLALKKRVNKKFMKYMRKSTEINNKKKQEKQTLAYYQMKKKLQRTSFKKQKRYWWINKKTMKNRNLTKYYW